LLLTLIIPVIQRYIRNFSPLLYFVALSVVALGVILHAANDRPKSPTTPSPIASVVHQLEPIDPSKLYVGPLEVAAPDPTEADLRKAAAPIVFSFLLLIAIAVFLRVAISQSSRRSIAPAVAIVVAGLVLLAAFMMRHPEGFNHAPLVHEGNK